ncbi:hypothetical protein ElyMa_003136600 [Elysia marginata]|uniref:Uncharacterized protein n=1 Tax=Elysia marginata TaxID=1093978 RepID=A0AAV4IU15_9GAST|nr:hypothetical protein ElyMa_003136600 [Elysia marginata]
MKKEISSENKSQIPTAMNGGKQNKSRPPSEKKDIISNNSPGSTKAAQTINGHSEREPRDENGQSDSGHSESDHMTGDHSSENGHSEEEPVAKTRAKTARPNGLRKSGRAGDTGSNPGSKPFNQKTGKSLGNKLEPLDQKNSTGNTPRSRGSDDSDSERKVSFRENLEEAPNATVPSAAPGAAPSSSSGDTAAVNRDRQNSLSKKRNNINNHNGTGERVWPSTARDTIANDLARDSPRHEGAVTWRKVNGDSMLVPRIGSRDADAWSEHSYGYGRCDQDLELTGRKFTRKSAKGNLG